MKPDPNPPTGTVVGFIRLHKTLNSRLVQVVDFTRYELTSHRIRFREENWLSGPKGSQRAGVGRNTDDFMHPDWANEFFANWVRIKVADHYAVLLIEGSPGPLRN